MIISSVRLGYLLTDYSRHTLFVRITYTVCNAHKDTKLNRCGDFFSQPRNALAFTRECVSFTSAIRDKLLRFRYRGRERKKDSLGKSLSLSNRPLPAT